MTHCIGAVKKVGKRKMEPEVKEKDCKAAFFSV